MKIEDLLVNSSGNISYTLESIVTCRREVERGVLPKEVLQKLADEMTYQIVEGNTSHEMWQALFLLFKRMSNQTQDHIDFEYRLVSPKYPES